MMAYGANRKMLVYEVKDAIDVRIRKHGDSIL
jgi:hypothetical protein